MKIPKKTTIDGRQWSITTDRKSNGAFCDSSKVMINIGAAEGCGLKNYLHECLEVILIESHNRYRNQHSDNNNGDYIFVFNHNEFEKICSDLSIVINDLLKCNKIS